MSSNGVALPMPRSDNITANLFNSVPVSTLLLSVILDFLCRPEYVEEAASFLRRFSHIAEATFADALCILVGCTLLLAWREFVPAVNGPGNNIPVETSDQEATGSAMADIAKVPSLSAEHTISVSEPVTTMDDQGWDSDTCTDNEVSSPMPSQSNQDAPAQEPKLGNEATGGVDSTEMSIIRQNSVHEEKLSPGEPRQLELDIYTKVEDIIMISEQSKRNGDLDLFGTNNVIASNIECPAVKFMMEEDKWWEKIPCGGSGAEIDIGVTEKIQCYCHGNPLRVAIASGQLRFVSYLLGTGYFDVNDTDGFGRSPLFNAASVGSTEITEILIRYGAKVNRKAGTITWINSPFYEACIRGHNRVVQLLLQHKVYVHEFPGVLQMACKKRNTAVVAALLRWRRQGSKYHQCALPLTGCMRAVTSGGNICDVLAQAGEEITTDPHWIRFRGYAVILQLLIEAGARHKDECDCGRSDWNRVHYILLWNKSREERERGYQALKPMGVKPYCWDSSGGAGADNKSVRDKWKCNCEYCFRRAKAKRGLERQLDESFERHGKDKDGAGCAETEALATIKEGFRTQNNTLYTVDHLGRTPQYQDIYSLYRTSDGLYQDSRGWYWESPNQYLQSLPWHPTWRSAQPLSWTGQQWIQPSNNIPTVLLPNGMLFYC